jgi:myo-inositol-1(or 4)-monophosphatase
LSKALRSPNINVMVNAAYLAARGERKARGLIGNFGEVENLQVSRKGAGDFVSEADHQAERILRRELEKARPAYGFLMEESGASPSADGEHRWIVDPLDGTTNFLHGIPHFAISIGLERAGDMVAGVVYDPCRDELFWAEKGVGAFLNDRRLRVSGRNRLPDAVVGTGTPFIDHGDHPLFAAEMTAVTKEVAGIRRLGAAALDLAYVAAGRFDAFWERGLDPWDIAAGIVLVREAGGYVSEIEGGHKMFDKRSILAANDHLHLPLGKLLRGAGTRARAKVASA